MPGDSHVLSTAILVAHWLIVVALSLRVLHRKLPVGVSLAWLAVVYAVPFVGAAAYLMLGGKRLDVGWRERQAAAEREAAPALRALREAGSAVELPAGSVGEPLWRETLGVLGTPALGGNRLQLLDEFGRVFDALVADIEAARTSCRLAFYIWQDGGRSDEVLAAILSAQARGVRCRVLVDAMGSAAFLSGTGCARLRDAGVAVVAALPRSFVRRADLRYHRKSVVIDDRVAYTGSQNLVDPRFFKREAGVGQWVDAMVRLEGPAVALIARQFEVDWAVDAMRPFEEAATAAEGVATSGAVIQVVPSGPTPYPDVIRQLTLTAIYAARRTLTITTPYFVPDDAVLTALRSAANAGVTVTVIVPAKNDSVLVRFASAATYEEVLAAGIRIALYEGGLLHTKSLVVDGALSLFGSVNLDMRSFWLDFEVSLFIYDEAFAAELGALQERYIQNSVTLDAAAWRSRPGRHRLLENAARLVGPLL